MAKLKLDEAGHAVLENGVPVYVLDDGKEVAIDGAKVHSTLGKIRDERDTAAGRASDLEAKLKRFGSSDEDWDRSLEKLKLARNIDEKKLIDAGKVDEALAERLKPFKEEADRKIAEIEAKVAEREGQLRKAVLGKAFVGTKAVEGTILTPSIAEAMFGASFDVENGEPVAYRSVGGKKERIYSRKDPGQLADFDEALAIQIQSHPDFGSWKKGSGATGGGAPGGASGPGNGRQMTRTEFESLPPDARMAHVKGGGQVTDGVN